MFGDPAPPKWTIAHWMLMERGVGLDEMLWSRLIRVVSPPGNGMWHAPLLRHPDRAMRGPQSEVGARAKGREVFGRIGGFWLVLLLGKTTPSRHPHW